MRGKSIPDTDHVVRHTKGSNVHETGRVSGAAFMLRATTPPEEYLSVNWLEHLHPTDIAIQTEKVRAEFAANLKLSRTQRLLRLGIGNTRQYVAQKMEGRSLAFHHEALPTSASHSGIYDCRPDQEMIADLIAETVIDIIAATADK